MGLGRPPKFHLARQVAAVLGYVSLMNLDRLVVAAMADGLAANLPPLRHASRILRLLQFLEELTLHGKKTDLLRAVQAFIKRPQRPGPVIVISDLYDPGGFQHAFDLLRFYGYDPRLVHLIDPGDAQPTLLGNAELVDVESQSTTEATITKRTVRRYQELLAEFHASVREYCRRRGIAYMPIPCDMPEDEVFRRVLGCRRNRSANSGPSLQSVQEEAG